MFRNLFLIATSLLALTPGVFAADESRITHKNGAEGKGVVLLDMFTFDTVVNHITGCKLVIAFFDKKTTIRPKDDETGIKPEVRSRSNFLDFAVEIQKSGDGAGAKDFLFAQVIINGYFLF